MRNQEFNKINLVGPCGFYCRTCRQYLARAKGCRIQDKNCAWVKRDCALLRKKQIEFCFECKDFPCANLQKLDQRHIREDNVSLIDNLLRIKEIGLGQWLEEQEDKWRCPQCGGNICVIDRKCYDCGYEIN